MSRASTLLAALTSEPTSTEALYERVGYATLTRLGLVPYDAFRAELVKLSAAGLAESDTADDGSTIWRLATPTDEPAPGGPTPPAPGEPTPPAPAGPTPPAPGEPTPPPA
jgi:hypothetical protein